MCYSKLGKLLHFALYIFNASKFDHCHKCFDKDSLLSYRFFYIYIYILFDIFKQLIIEYIYHATCVFFLIWLNESQDINGKIGRYILGSVLINIRFVFVRFTITTGKLSLDDILQRCFLFATLTQQYIFYK